MLLGGFFIEKRQCGQIVRLVILDNCLLKKSVTEFEKIAKIYLKIYAIKYKNKR